MIDFSSELNAEQLRAVLDGGGSCLILAGAGSGKTRTITYRVAYLLERGILPENILLVTFTNKAAEQMKERVGRLVGGGVLPWSGTFHHIAYRILKIYAPLLGYNNNFTVLDSDDSKAILKLCIKNIVNNVETRHASSLRGDRRFPSANVVLSVISYARNSELTVDKVIEDRFFQWSQFTDEIKNIASEYARRKKESNAMDFDDLLTNFLLLLNDEKIRHKYATQFQYILVDEYQDTNKIQASIIRALASVHNNLFVVGDDAQSIYSFRAADIHNILGYELTYPGAKVFKLETNYRSTEKILDVANNVIANNREQYKKELRVAMGAYINTPLPSATPALYPQMDQQSEAAFVAKKIEEHLGQGVSPSEIAVLFRAAYHSQMLEVELVQRGIAYDYRGGVRFFERAHIKDILAYLRILNNVSDTAAWLRILMHEEGVGPTAAQKIVGAIHELPLRQVAAIGSQILGAKAQVGWNNFLKIWTSIVDIVGANGRSPLPATLIETIIQSPYREYLEAEYIDSRDRLADIKQLALFSERYNDLSQFLAEMTLQESFRGIGGGGESKEKIILSTIHQAKGLEWTVVFIIDLASGAFPSDRSLKEHSGLEEERRLLYVAITRAKKFLYLTYPLSGGSFGDSLSGPSLFLNEINSELLEDHSLLSTDSTVFDDPSEGVQYVDEYKPKKIKSGSFLVDINDL